MFISRDRYRDLLAAEMKLIALESGGVDNWNWYGESIRDYLNEINREYKQDFEDFEEVATFELDNDKYNG